MKFGIKGWGGFLVQIIDILLFKLKKTEVMHQPALKLILLVTIYNTPTNTVSNFATLVHKHPACLCIKIAKSGPPPHSGTTAKYIHKFYGRFLKFCSK